MKKKALITGISGQDGAYLAQYLLNQNYKVFGLDRRTASNNFWRLEALGIKDQVIRLQVDLTEYSSIRDIISSHNFNEIYNLAAQSFVASSWDNPITTSTINSIAVTNLLDTIYRFSPKTKFYQASTSEMFGNAKIKKQNELTPFNPRSPYGVSKLYAHWITKNYRESYGLFAACGILFNHESPLRGEEFVTKKIISQLVEIKKGSIKTLKLGNIYAKRDWGFAGDYVEAMFKILQHNQPDDFVIGTGKSYSIKEFINLCLDQLKIEYKWMGSKLNEVCLEKNSKRKIIAIDPSLYRPAEVDTLTADAIKAKKVLGWSSKTSLRKLIKLMIEFELSK
ncbi:GDP-mannose 4,6-dehydratase [Gammaproteobacteria bacterium]|nr:GDP-mannose 4,6-dehydratase [Gammaproteobacteria bacterium]